MLPAALFDRLSGRLTEGAGLAQLAPAFAFWFGALAVLERHRSGGFWGWGLASLVPGRAGWPVDRAPSLAQLSELERAVPVAVLVVASAIVAELFVLRTLQLAEGYWPRWLLWLRRRSIDRQRTEVRTARQELEDLRKRYKNLNEDDLQRYDELVQQFVIQLPKDDARLMPTTLGNVLAAAESRPGDKYGLDALVCWPRLWLVIPDAVRGELVEARSVLNAWARAGLWSGLFVIWAVWAWWALPAGVLATVLVYRELRSKGSTYGKLFESAFDVHRPALYQSLRWPMPTNPMAEREEGLAITQYLYYGSAKEMPMFTGSNPTPPA